MWSSMAEVLQCYCDFTILPVSLLLANPVLPDWSKGALCKETTCCFSSFGVY